jgi:hypothetical protein
MTKDFRSMRGHRDVSIAMYRIRVLIQILSGYIRHKKSYAERAALSLASSKVVPEPIPMLISSRCFPLRLVLVMDTRAQNPSPLGSGSTKWLNVSGPKSPRHRELSCVKIGCFLRYESLPLRGRQCSKQRRLNKGAPLATAPTNTVIMS